MSDNVEDFPSDPYPGFKKLAPDGSGEYWTLQVREHGNRSASEAMWWWRDKRGGEHRLTDAELQRWYR